MKRAYRHIRLWMVRQVMEAMALLGRIVQLGSPYGRGPSLQKAPRPDETLGVFQGGKVYEFANGIIAGESNGLVISERNEFFENLTYYFRGARLHPGVVRLMVSPVRKLPGVGVALCSISARGNYYHWMIDLVTRLETVEQAGFHPGNIDWVFSNGDGRPYETEVFLAYGFRLDQLQFCSETQRFQVDRLIVPDFNHDELDFAPSKSEFLQRLFPPSPESARRLLFCGRKDQKVRQLRNEDELFARLSTLGFERVITAGKSVADQARLFSEARVIVGVHGAMLTNIVFTRPGAWLIDIQSRDSPRHYYASICAGIGIRNTIVSAQPVSLGLNPVELNNVDITLSAAQIDSIIQQVTEELAA